MNKILFALVTFCLVFFSHPSFAQTYRHRIGLDISLGTITIGAGTTALVKQKKNQGFTESEIQQLQYNINKFDYSSINRSFNKRIHLGSDVMMMTAAATPLLLLIDSKVRNRSELKHIAPMWAETFALTYALTGMTKELVRRTRPYVYYDDVPLEKKMKKEARASFFSGHTSMTAASTFFTAKIYADMNPNSRWKPLVWTGAAMLPLGVGLMRYSGGKHFWTDIITGYIVGATVGILVPHLHRNKNTPE